MLTDRGKLLLVAAAGLWLGGRILGVPELWMAAVATLALVGLAVAYTRVASAQLALRRGVHPPQLFHDAEAEVTLDLRNEGRLATAVLVVEDSAPAALADPPRFVLDPLPPGRTTRVRYALRGRQRGRYRVGPAQVALRDPFGVARRPLRFGSTEQVTVYPPVWALPDVLPRLGRQGTSFEGTPRPIASSGEFANVREYVRGDDLRKVHWRSTAHRGKLMVKQEETPQDVQATIVLDLRRDVHRGAGPASTFEEAITAAASAAYHLADRRYSLRLVTGPLEGPPPAMTWQLVLEQLAGAEPQRAGSLRPVWQQLANGLGGNGLLLAVLPPPPADDLRDLVRAGRTFASRIAVLVAPAGRAAHHAPQSLLALRAAGWRATVHHPGDRLDVSWQQLALRPTAAAAGGGR